MGQRAPDLLFTVPCRGRPAEVHLLYEHQSRSQRLVPFRMLRGAVLRWDDLLRSERPPRRLPAIVPILVAQTGHRWTQRDGMAGLWDLDPPMFRALSPHLPSFRPLLVDLASLPEEKLGGTPAGQLALRLLKYGRDQGLWQRLALWRPLVLKLSPEAMGPMLSYLVQVAGVPAPEALESALPSVVVEQAMTEGQLFWKKVADESWVKGHQRGVEEGREEGKVIGTAHALVTFLERNHGRLAPEQRARVFAATEAVLGEWLLRAFDGASPAELL